MQAQTVLALLVRVQEAQENVLVHTSALAEIAGAAAATVHVAAIAWVDSTCQQEP